MVEGRAGSRWWRAGLVADGGGPGDSTGVSSVVCVSRWWRAGLVADGGGPGW